MDKSIKGRYDKILVFTLDELACALHISNFVKVIRAMEISNLPKAPEIIKGTINFKGQTIPVVDIRKRFGHLRRDTVAQDRIIIAETGKRQLAFFVDSVSEIKKPKSKKSESSTKSLSCVDNMKGVPGFEYEMLQINSLEYFLSLDEEKVLEEALNPTSL